MLLSFNFSSNARCLVVSRVFQILNGRRPFNVGGSNLQKNHLRFGQKSAVIAEPRVKKEVLIQCRR